MTATLLLLAAQLCAGAPAAGQPAGPADEAGVAYMPGGGPQQQLDLFLPAGRGFATVLFVHGGGLTQEDRKDAPYPGIAAAFRSAGLACANMNYRLLPGAAWPAPVQDGAAATAWLKKNIAARGGEPAKIVLVGHSSGAMLVALVACDEKYLKAVGLSAKDVAG